MKKLFIILCVTLLFFSCKKAKTDNVPEVPEFPVVAKVKTISNLSGTIVQNYTYDATGRQISWQLNMGARTEHIYDGSLVIKVYSNPSTGSINGRDTLTLNTQGLLVKATNYLNPGLLNSYEYNTDRFLTKKSTSINGSFSGEERFYYTNNLLDSVVYYNNTSNRYFVTKNTNYNTAKANTVGNYNYGEYYFGRQSASPHSRFEVFTVDQNRVTQYNEISYQFDAEGRIVNEINNTTQVNLGLPNVTTTSAANISYY